MQTIILEISVIDWRDHKGDRNDTLHAMADAAEEAAQLEADKADIVLNVDLDIDKGED